MLELVRKSMAASAGTAIALVLVGLVSESTRPAYADELYDTLKAQLGDKDQKHVALALSQAATLARVCERKVDDTQFQNAMRISGIEVQDLADGGKLHDATQQGVASVDSSACASAEQNYGAHGSEIRGLLK